MSVNAYLEGLVAGEADAKRSDNPYINGPAIAREEWDDGWKTGRLNVAFRSAQWRTE